MSLLTSSGSKRSLSTTSLVMESVLRSLSYLIEEFIGSGSRAKPSEGCRVKPSKGIASK